jgi:hypothetical protein
VITRSRDFLIESFMGTDEVVLISEAIEASLLRRVIGGRRASGILFEGKVKAFVATILLRAG